MARIREFACGMSFLFQSQFGIFFMLPPRGLPRCGGGPDFVSAIATARAAPFLPTKLGRKGAGTKLSMPKLRRHWRRGATARLTPAQQHRPTADATIGLS